MPKPARVRPCTIEISVGPAPRTLATADAGTADSADSAGAAQDAPATGRRGPWRAARTVA